MLYRKGVFPAIDFSLFGRHFHFRLVAPPSSGFGRLPGRFERFIRPKASKLGRPIRTRSKK
jgi:hypothetical protein